MQIKVSMRLLRFVNHLDPTVTKSNWTTKELETLYEKYN